MRLAIWLVFVSLAAVLGWHDGEKRQRQAETSHILEKPGSSFLIGEREARPAGTAVVMTASVASFPQRLKRALERSETGASYEVQLLFARWFQEDREALQEWVFAQHPAPLALLARLWVREDPSSIWLEARHTRASTWHRAVFNALATEDPLCFFKSIEDRKDKSDHVPEYLSRRAAEILAQRDFSKAETMVSSLSNQRMLASAMIGLASIKATQAPFDEALAWASNLEPPSNAALATVIDSIAPTDLSKAVRLLFESGLRAAPLLSQINQQLGSLPLRDAIALLRQYPVPYRLNLPMDDLPRDPMEALALLKPLDARGNGPSLNRWQPDIDETDVATTLTLLASDANSPAHKSLFEKSLQTLSREFPDMTLNWIQSQRDPAARSLYAAQILPWIGWTAASEQSGLNLPDLVDLIDPECLPEERNHLRHGIYSRISTVLQQLTHEDPNQAIDRASRIQVDHWRRMAYGQIARTWMEHDEQAALDWLGALPPGDRRDIVKRLPSRLKRYLTP